MIPEPIEYKFRMPETTQEKLHTYAGSYGTKPSEIIRMALRRWNRLGRVAVDEFYEPATRGASTPYTVTMSPRLVKDGEGKIPGKLAVAVVKWYLSQYPETPEVKPFHPTLREGVDYICEEA